MFLVSNSISVTQSQAYLDYLSSFLKIFAFQEDLDKSILSVLMLKKKLGSFDDLVINTSFQSFICLPQYRYEHFLASTFCKVFLALLNRIQPILERLNENITKPWKSSIIDRSNKWCLHWYSFKFKRLVILNVHDVKNQSINEQENAIFEICVNSILYLLKK